MCHACLQPMLPCQACRHLVCSIEISGRSSLDTKRSLTLLLIWLDHARMAWSKTPRSHIMSHCSNQTGICIFSQKSVSCKMIRSGHHAIFQIPEASPQDIKTLETTPNLLTGLHCTVVLQVFEAQALRHPAEVEAMQGRSFVPNNICLGGSSPGFVLLTGPNMGGKSTLLRQVSTSDMWLSLAIGQLWMQTSSNHVEQFAVALQHPSSWTNCLEACC